MSGTVAVRVLMTARLVGLDSREHRGQLSGHIEAALSVTPVVR